MNGGVTCWWCPLLYFLSNLCSIFCHCDGRDGRCTPVAASNSHPVAGGLASLVHLTVACIGVSSLFLLFAFVFRLCSCCLPWCFVFSCCLPWCFVGGLGGVGDFSLFNTTNGEVFVQSNASCWCIQLTSCCCIQMRARPTRP